MENEEWTTLVATIESLSEESLRELQTLIDNLLEQKPARRIVRILLKWRNGVESNWLVDTKLESSKIRTLCESTLKEFPDFSEIPLHISKKIGVCGFQSIIVQDCTSNSNLDRFETYFLQEE